MPFWPKKKHPYWFLYGYVWAVLYYLILYLITGKFIDPSLFAVALIYSEITFLFGYYNKMIIFWCGFIGMAAGFINLNSRHLFWILSLIVGTLATIFKK